MSRNEHSNRTAKARRLAAILTEHGVSRTAAKNLPESIWATIADLDAARTGRQPRTPSAATRAEVLLQMPLDDTDYAETEELLATGF